jgi:hypothetical protein
MGLLFGCGDGDGTRAGEQPSRPGGGRDAPGERGAENSNVEDDAANSEDDAGLPEPPQVDASAAFSDWLADSGVPLSAWLGDAGPQQTPATQVPALDPDLKRALLGRAYAESTYELKEPKALSTAFAAATKLTGDTRLFVTSIQEGDAGTEVLYGAADLIDAGLEWQKPPAHPRRFALGEGTNGAVTSAPFTYVLEARIAVSSVYRLYLEAERSIWSATFNSDRTTLAAELTGAVTRAQLEHRPLDRLSCIAACGQRSAEFCDATPLRLSAVLDCTATAADLDLNSDGSNDAYRLHVVVRGAEVPPPRE